MCVKANWLKTFRGNEQRDGGLHPTTVAELSTSTRILLHLEETASDKMSSLSTAEIVAVASCTNIHPKMPCSLRNQLRRVQLLSTKLFCMSTFLIYQKWPALKPAISIS